HFDELRELAERDDPGYPELLRLDAGRRDDRNDLLRPGLERAQPSVDARASVKLILERQPRDGVLLDRRPERDGELLTGQHDRPHERVDAVPDHARRLNRTFNQLAARTDRSGRRDLLIPDRGWRGDLDETGQYVVETAPMRSIVEKVAGNAA